MKNLSKRPLLSCILASTSPFCLPNHHAAALAEVIHLVRRAALKPLKGLVRVVRPPVSPAPHAPRCPHRRCSGSSWPPEGPSAHPPAPRGPAAVLLAKVARSWTSNWSFRWALLSGPRRKQGLRRCDGTSSRPERYIVWKIGHDVCNIEVQYWFMYT